MIYTITLNPSIDYVMHLDKLDEGTLNRVTDVDYLPGGKGINVSQVLAEMKLANIALGFAGDFTGQFIKESLEAKKITTDFIPVNEPTRINVKLKTQQETEINAQGPPITEDDIQALLEKISRFSSQDIVILSGSIPQASTNKLYERIVRAVTEVGAQFIVDAEDDLLKQTLAYQPLMIKPNQDELSQFFKVKIKNPKDALPYAKKLLEAGPQSVIVSFAGDGALYVSDQHIYYGRSPKGKVENSVGAGDSLVAGFVGRLTKTNHIKEAFQYALACGSATAFSPTLAKKADIEKLFHQVKIEDWSDQR